MEYRRFGPTDLTVSAIGFGCWDSGIWPSGYDDMAGAIHHALDQGITCFDTAPNYRESESMLGRALGPRRKDVVVVTKCGLGFEGSSVGRPKGRDSRRESILSLVDQSLRRMQTDYIDVLLVHLPDVNTPFEETMGALDTVVRQGKVRSVGVSNFTLEQIKECEATRRIEVVEYDRNMFDRRTEQEILPYCQQQGIGMMTYGSMGFGLLAGAYTADTKFGDGDIRGTGGAPGFDGGMFAPEHWQRNVRLVDDLKPIAASRGKTMPQLALRWVLSHPAVSVALVGTLNVQELEENLGVMDWALSGEDMRQIDEVFARYGVDTRPDISLDP
jgi:aryl-alcohol dehydrogenase-like predicted oxidoreductase